MSNAVISLFTGGGGLDLGLESAGFETRVGVEVEPQACRVLRQNRERAVVVRRGQRFLEGCEILERDIREVQGEELLEAAGLAPGEAALLAGGPPCVTFSVAGRREGLTTDQGLLFREYVRLLEIVRPAGLVYENVKGLLTAVGSDGTPGGAFQEILTAIRAAGYCTSWRLVNAADFGVPQFRERVIVLGLRGDVVPSFPGPTHADPRRPAGRDSGVLAAWRDVASAIGDLPPAAEPGEHPPIPNHVARNHSADVVASFAATPPGKRNERFKRDRLLWDRPSKVIRAQGKPKPDGSGQKNSSHQPLHPEENRQLTPRECARIQTFPDWYWLPGTFVNAYRIVGDAVPPVLGEALGRHMLSLVGSDRGLLAAA